MMSKIKVLLFCSSLNIGGTERNVVNIAKQIDKTKFDAEVFCFYGSGPLENELNASGVHYAFGEFYRIFDKSAYLRTFKAFRKNNFNILHCFGYPTIYFGILLGRLTGIKNIIVAVQALDTWKSKIYILLDKILSPFVDLYISDSEGARKFAIDQLNIIPEKIITLYDGVDLSSLKPTRDPNQVKKELGIYNNSPVVSVVARLQDEHKGQSYFIRAVPIILKEFSDATFLIVGDGIDRKHLESLAKETGVSNKIIFAGFRTDLANIFSITDILVIPSVQWESITKTMLEAMSMELPIIATNVGDLCEVFKNRETGILINPRNSIEIANAVTYLLKNPEIARQFGQNGANEIHKLGLTLEKSVKSLEDIYSQKVSEEKNNSFIKKSLIKIYFYIVFVFVSVGFFGYKAIESLYRRLISNKNLKSSN